MASRISRTIGKPALSALREVLLADRLQAGPQRALAGEVNRDRAARADVQRLEQLDATSVERSSSTSTASGTSIGCGCDAARSAAVRARRRSGRRGRSSPAALAIALDRRADLSRCGAGARHEDDGERRVTGRPGSRATSWSVTAADCEPGTPKPPPVRWSDWCIASGRADDEQHDPEAEHHTAVAVDGPVEAIHDGLHVGSFRAALDHSLAGWPAKTLAEELAGWPAGRYCGRFARSCVTRHRRARATASASNDFAAVSAASIVVW